MEDREDITYPLPRRYVDPVVEARAEPPSQRMREIRAMTDEELVAAIRQVNRRPFLTTPTRQDLEERLFDYQ